MAESSPIPIDYTSRDYASLRADLISAIPAWLPEWTNRSESDFGIVLIEMFAYVGDILGYYLDRTANEAYISTAVQRASVLSLAQMIDYRPSGLAASNVTLTITVSASAPGAVTVPAGTQVSTLADASADPIVFETDEEVVIAIGGTGQVTATEGVTVIEGTEAPVGISTGASDQVFPLYRPDIIDGTLNVFVDEDGAAGAEPALWRFLTHLIDASSEDRAYTTSVDENGVTYVFFGDNVNGRIPTQGSVVTATYRVGTGAKGNVGAGTITEFVLPVVGVDSVTNPAGASGGSDAESIDSIRRNAPRSLTTLERAVTTADYETLAKKIGGIEHARAVAEVYTNVLLYLAPTGGGTASTALKNEVLNYLDTRKMINTVVTVGDPTYVDINVSVNPLHVLPQYNRQAVETAVENAIVDALDISKTGFGFRVTRSQIYQAIQNVEGVDWADLTELNRTGTGLGEVELADNEIPDVGVITVTATGGLIGS